MPPKLPLGKSDPKKNIDVAITMLKALENYLLSLVKNYMNK
jgi:hypothetical protein